MMVRPRSSNLWVGVFIPSVVFNLCVNTAVALSGSGIPSACSGKTISADPGGTVDYPTGQKGIIIAHDTDNVICMAEYAAKKAGDPDPPNGSTVRGVHRTDGIIYLVLSFTPGLGATTSVLQR